ncbi:MAG TPA: iron chelate uptake ABC transporter family permease subunit [Candidatus Nitrosotenuis sp.]|nr:iron chelate uptake ABC transporter family permease subunit [Candidatus Nitrosotenuis sp.]
MVHPGGGRTLSLGLRIAAAWGGGLVLLAAAMLAGLAAGSVALSPAEVWQALFHPLGLPEAHVSIIRDIRLPRVLLGASVGAALALAGTAFQGLLRNPLADPYIVGTSAGASLGAALAIELRLPSAWGLSPVPALAFPGAVLSMLAVYRLARMGPTLPVETFLLAGVMVGSFTQALVSFLMTLGHQDLPRIIFWLMGSLSNARWTDLAMLLPYLALGAVLLYRLSVPLNVMSLGEETAWSLGVEVERTKVWVVLAGSLVTAAAVSVSGLIGFLGLLVPHLARMLVGPDHRVLFPAALLGGGAFLVLADLAARVLLASRELPVGVVTALVGAPFFFWLLHRRRGLT